MNVYNPVSTYRLQFNKQFTFNDAIKALPYLHKLGIKTIYASPIFAAVSGSMHGYDVTDPLELNPELGTTKDFEKLMDILHQFKMGWIQDVVPNHMAYSVENKWIYDVLEKGAYSAYIDFFDIDARCKKSMLKNKLMLPFFGKPADELVKNKEIQLVLRSTGLKLKYYETEYPVSYPGYANVFSQRNNKHIPEEVSRLLKTANQNNIPNRQFSALFKKYTNTPSVKTYVDSCLDEVNNSSGEMLTFLSRLYYRPAFWKETNECINYRRFFTVNGLICLNMQNKKVFDTYHSKIFSLINEGKFNGLRIDHIDGLFDANLYVRTLRERTGKKAYQCVEKILEENENIPKNWPIEGTTGYDFLVVVNNLLTNSGNADKFQQNYHKWSGDETSYRERAEQAKRFILYERLQGELNKLSQEYTALYPEIAQRYSNKKIREAIGEFLVHFPVYKIYPDIYELTDYDKKLLQHAFRRAREKEENKNIGEILSVVQQSLFVEPDKTGEKTNVFFRHLMQYTGPLMAKGIEDTVFYNYVPFIAHNEVGDSPEYFGMSKARFHEKMVYRQLNSPMALNCTSTHDTKRGEDARARLNAISDIPDEWVAFTQKWRNQNAPFKQKSDSSPIPDTNDEYLIYQTLVGHLPLNLNIDNTFVKRLEEYIIKALREAKEHTSWNEPKQKYENITVQFIREILSSHNSFKQSLLVFMEKIMHAGIINSIAQTVLKYTAPGVPDTYQGTENWNFSFVDPDNRRPVDYKKFGEQLKTSLEEYAINPVKTLLNYWNNPQDGTIKQLISFFCLQKRREFEKLFLKGSYEPLEVKGKYKDHLAAFYRRYEGKYLLVILPLHTGAMPIDHTWEETSIQLPYFSPSKWEQIFTKEKHTGAKKLHVGELFQHVPFAVLFGETSEPVRRAGILMHISSLPGPFGVGDFGNEAFRFVDFLSDTEQHIWQTLPLNIASKQAAYSPYSSYSAFACNTVFISPEKLLKQGLVNKSDVQACYIQSSETVNYEMAEGCKNSLIKKAFDSYQKSKPPQLKSEFEQFIEKEHYWLHDFALFTEIKKQHENKPWNQWPKHFRNKNNQTLKKFERENSSEIKECKFAQFLAYNQWEELKQYANQKDIKLFGDIPIYVAYDSSDVWANPALFQLNDDMSMNSVAGVPPDYFNENGQLWGMPVFNWKKMEQEGFKWWLNRLHKNLEWFDLVRLDHFRGFSAYWEVSANEETALNGKWVKGPGDSLFDAVKKRFPDMPFVAEDLGQIDQDVYDLRDKFQLPGMKIVQFGFGNNMPFLQHVPHNHTYNSIAYTGTHDNNTMNGWFRTEMDKATKQRIEKYTGVKLKKKKCHTTFIRMAYASVSKIAIIPMQDWLGLNEKHRMNFPSTTSGNWLWRMDTSQWNKKLENAIQKTVKTYGRY